MTEGEEMSSCIGRIEELTTIVRDAGESISDLAVKSKLISGLSTKYRGFSRF